MSRSASEHKEFQKKLMDKFEKEKKIVDQDVRIRDILVYREYQDQTTYRYSFGERYKPSIFFSHISVVNRLEDHISIIAQIATKVHQHYYCRQISDKDYEIKDNFKNTITRISLNEFSLYTAEPLTLFEFNYLVGRIESIASKQPENIHLVLSSLAVVTEDKKLLNMCIYVECGKPSTLHAYAKAKPSSVDPTFPNTELFAQEPVTHKSRQFTAMETKGIISNNGIFEIKTLGGAKYLQAVDICLDYRLEHSKNILSNLLDLTTSQRSDFLPEQIDHLVTSNPMELFDDKNISTKTTLVDPVYSGTFMPDSVKDDDFIAELKLDIPAEYKQTTINKKLTTGKPHLVIPPFGAVCKINILPERTVGRLKGSLAGKGTLYNDTAKTQFVHTGLDLASPQCEVQKFYDCLSKLKELSDVVETVCNVSPMEIKLNTAHYHFMCKINAEYKAFNKEMTLLINQRPINFLEKFCELLTDLRDSLDGLHDRESPHPRIKMIQHQISYVLLKVAPVTESRTQSHISR